jgi:hypothetical protein
MKGTSSISLICNNLFERGNYLLRLLIFVKRFFTSTTLDIMEIDFQLHIHNVYVHGQRSIYMQAI